MKIKRYDVLQDFGFQSVSKKLSSLSNLRRRFLPSIIPLSSVKRSKGTEMVNSTPAR